MFFSLSFFFLCSVFCVKFPGRPLAPDYLKKRPCSKTLKKSRKFCILKNDLNVFLVPAVHIRIFELCVAWCKLRVFGTVVFEDDAETFFAFFVLNSSAWRFLDPVFFLFLNSIFSFLINNWIQKRLKRKKTDQSKNDFEVLLTHHLWRICPLCVLFSVFFVSVVWLFSIRVVCLRVVVCPCGCSFSVCVLGW